MTVPDHFFTQSAVLPLRDDDGCLQVLLITSRKRKRWVLPKGVKEPELSMVESAAKEAWEEAGIEGDIEAKPLGTYVYRKWKGLCSVEVYRMRVRKIHSTWPEQERDRRWFSPQEAASRVDEPELKKIILSGAA